MIALPYQTATSAPTSNVLYINGVPCLCTSVESMGCGVSRRVDAEIVPPAAALVVEPARGVPDEEFFKMAVRASNASSNAWNLRCALQREECRVSIHENTIRFLENDNDSLTLKLRKQEKETEEWKKKWSQSQDKCRALSQALEK
jgi:hypothetical protein